LRRARGRAAEEGHSAAEQPALSQARDTGLALVLLLLLAAQIGGRYALLPLAIGLLVLSMLWPALFRLPARLWFGLAEVLGTLVSTLVLTLVFVLVLTPIATLRRLLGADPLRGRAWRQGQDSLLICRDHTFTAADMERPY